MGEGHEGLFHLHVTPQGDSPKTASVELRALREKGDLYAQPLAQELSALSARMVPKEGAAVLTQAMKDTKDEHVLLHLAVNVRFKTAHPRSW